MQACLPPTGAVTDESSSDTQGTVHFIFRQLRP